MVIALNNISPEKSDNKTRTRVGRGIGSGKGKTCGRGHKGQKSRSGVAIKGFEGGQMPIHRRLPKRGFNNYNRQEFEVLNLSDLQSIIDDKKAASKDTLNIELLEKIGAVKNNKSGVKILGKGELKASVTIEVHKVSESAKKAIEKAGGKVTIIENSSKSSKKEDDKKSKSTKKS